MVISQKITKASVLFLLQGWGGGGGGGGCSCVVSVWDLDVLSRTTFLFRWSMHTPKAQTPALAQETTAEIICRQGKIPQLDHLCVTEREVCELKYPWTSLPSPGFDAVQMLRQYRVHRPSPLPPAQSESMSVCKVSPHGEMMFCVSSKVACHCPNSADFKLKQGSSSDSLLGCLGRIWPLNVDEKFQVEPFVKDSSLQSVVAAADHSPSGWPPMWCFFPVYCRNTV